MSERDLLMRIDERVNTILERIDDFVTQEQVQSKIELHGFTCRGQQQLMDWRKLLLIVLAAMGFGSASGVSIVEIMKNLLQ